MSKQVTLGDVAWIDARIVDPKQIHHANLPHVSGENIVSITGELRSIKSASEDGMESGKYLFVAGDVLYSKLRPYLKKASVISFDGLCSADMYPIKTDLNRLLPDFLRSILVSSSFTEFANEASARSRMPKLNREQLFAYQFELPSLDEQKNITVSLKIQLAAAEEARQAAQAQLNEIRLLKTQALKAVFSAIENTCRLGDVARIQSGYAFKSETFQKQGVGLLRNANMAPGRVYWDDAVYLSPAAAPAHAAYALAAGDVLISLDRPIISTGIKVARVTASDLPALLVQRVGRFRIDETRLNADYLYAFLHTEPFIDAISGHEQSLGVPHVSPGQIEAIEIALPNIEEQQRLAVILNNIAQATQEAQTAAEQQLRDIELLPSRLLAQAFDSVGIKNKS